MDLRIIDESQITPALDEAIRKGLCACFPKDAEHFRLSRDWHGSFPAWSAAVLEGEEVVAHAGVVDRVISAGAETIRVAGIQNVFVLPTYRGRGLVDRVMSACMEEAMRRGPATSAPGGSAPSAASGSAQNAAEGFDCGLLFCVPALEKVYARSGWLLLPVSRVTRIDEAGREAPLPGVNIGMFLPLRRADFPRGDIHLRGNDW